MARSMRNSHLNQLGTSTIVDLQSTLSGKVAQDRATDLLREDHTQLRALFDQYRRAASERWDNRQALAEEICMQLEVHSRVEEEIFYPAIFRIDARFVVRALEAHAEITERIAQVKEHSPDDPLYDAVIAQIMCEFEPHVLEEERLLDVLERRVPEALGVLRARITRRKEQLTGSTQEIEGRS